MYINEDRVILPHDEMREALDLSRYSNKSEEPPKTMMELLQCAICYTMISYDKKPK
jgi:hypothetical protein